MSEGNKPICGVGGEGGCGHLPSINEFDFAGYSHFKTSILLLENVICLQTIRPFYNGAIHPTLVPNRISGGLLSGVEISFSSSL